MIESVDKLRELAADINSTEIISHMDVAGTFGFHTEWLDSWYKAFDAACDAIEREIAERYVELPVDADGVPWHIGDMVEGHGKVQSLDLNCHGWAFFGVENAIDPAIHRHAKPRTVEDAARDFVNSVVTFKGSRDGIPIVGIDDSLWRDYFPEFADELRELMEVG